MTSLHATLRDALTECYGYWLVVDEVAGDRDYAAHAEAAIAAWLADPATTTHAAQAAAEAANEAWGGEFNVRCALCGEKVLEQRFDPQGRRTHYFIDHRCDPDKAAEWERGNEAFRRDQAEASKEPIPGRVLDHFRQLHARPDPPPAYFVAVARATLGSLTHPEASGA